MSQEESSLIDSGFVEGIKNRLANLFSSSVRGIYLIYLSLYFLDTIGSHTHDLSIPVKWWPKHLLEEV